MKVNIFGRSRVYMRRSSHFNVNYVREHLRLGTDCRGMFEWCMTPSVHMHAGSVLFGSSQGITWPSMFGQNIPNSI